MKKTLFLAALAAAILALACFGCNSEEKGCGPGEQAGLVLDTFPASGQAEANGSDAVKVTSRGKDDNCKPFAEGTPIQFSITDQIPANSGDQPAEVGYFQNGDTEITVTTGPFGASVDVFATKPGTAKVGAYSVDYNLTGSPVDIEFVEPTVPGQCAIALAANPASIDADGISTSNLTATLTNDTGGSMPDGTTVSFETNLGAFTQNQGQAYNAQSTNNVAHVTLQSEALETSADAEVAATFSCNDGNSYTDRQTVRFNVGDLPSLQLTASSDQVLADDTSSVTLTAQVYSSGTTTAGAGEAVTFTTDLGRFAGSGDVTQTADTDAGGKATAELIGGTEGGTATATAEATIDGHDISDQVEISVRKLGSIEFVSAVPNQLGTAGSGMVETSVVTFIVRDTRGDPYPAGADVHFTLSNTAGGLALEDATVSTEDTGEVHAHLNAGTAATTVTVTAEIGPLQAVSTPIAIVGAKPVSGGMTFWCDRFNIGALVVPDIETQCTITLIDHHSNPIGLPIQINFMTEAGGIDSPATIEVSGANVGQATTTITNGAPWPKDVLPDMGAHEPYIGNHNPRDGLVTIMAYTTGDEAFTDSNGNGRYDDGEPFVDTVEPFLDKDDDGVWDPDEPYIDSDESETYTGKNTVWDGDTHIWTQTHMLWTGELEEGDPANDCSVVYRYSVVCPGSFDIAKGDELRFDWEIKDINLNPLNETAQVDVAVTGKGSLGIVMSPPLPWTGVDTLGGFVDPSHFWEDCGGGQCGWVIVKGAPESDTTGPETGAVTMDVDYQQTPGGADRSATILVMGTFQ